MRITSRYLNQAQDIVYGNYTYISDKVNRYIKSKNVKVICTIDQSKTGTGVTIGDIYGNIIDVLEIQGPREDATIVSIILEQTLVELLKGVQLVTFALEALVHMGKKSGKYSYNIQNQLSEIYASVKRAGYRLFNLDSRNIVIINNKSWKEAVVPKRFQYAGTKFSKLYLTELDVKYAQYTDNETDSVCMYLYIIKTLYSNVKYKAPENLSEETNNINVKAFFVTKESLDEMLSKQNIVLEQIDLNQDITVLQNFKAAFSNMPNANAILVDKFKIRWLHPIDIWQIEGIQDAKGYILGIRK